MDTSDAHAGGRLTVGELAALAGVTPRAIRHWHAQGLLPEPARDGAGYRRYGTVDVVAAVRVARLRALGMPISRIAASVADRDETPSSALGALADELDEEIARLTAVRDRLRRLAGSETLEHPAETLERAVRSRGRLGPDEALPPAERSAAALVHALSPGGLPAVLEQADALVADPAAAARFSSLVARFRDLPAEAADAEVDALATDAAELLPRPLPGAAPVDVRLVDRLLGDRLHPAQRRLLHRLRALLAERA